ncbi:MAG: hypothetical protein R3212_11190, partial [Xanthomonadales bacterium]|nr:hypothetical protein [Xanthomonadales bacterium]
GLMHLAFLGITFFTDDSTRVFAMLAWAPALHALMYAVRVHREAGRERIAQGIQQALLLLAIVGLLVPRFLIWESRIVPTPFNDFYYFILKSLANLLGIST